jgi:hypothetical protein
VPSLHACRSTLEDPPQDFSQKLYKGEKAEVQMLVDGTYPSRAEVVKGYLTAINALFNQRLRKGKDNMRPPFERYRARIRNHGHSCFLCEIVIRSQFHTTYEPEA